MKWWDRMPWSSFSECWAVSQLFHSLLLLSSRGFLGPLHFLPKGWCQLQKHLAAAKSLQSCPTLCDPIDSSLPGSPVPGILEARTLEWVTISFSNAWKWKLKVKLLSSAKLLATPWTAAYQAPLSMGFSSKSTGVGCHCLLRKSTLEPF